MGAHQAFSPETRRVVAQWIGIAVASIASGVILGTLLRSGLNQTYALEVALPFGFLLTLLLWVFVDRWFSVKSMRKLVAAPLSTNMIIFEAPLETVAFSTAPNFTMASQAPTE